MVQQVLNTLYVQTEGCLLRLDHENVVVEAEQQTLLRVPLHHLGGIVALGRVNTTGPLLAKCAEDGRSVVHLDNNGRFLYRIEGKRSGNVLLRTAQHRVLRCQEDVVSIIQGILAGKLYNSRQML